MNMRCVLVFLMIFILVLGCKSDNDKNEVQDITHKLFQLESRGWKSITVSHFLNDITYRATEVPIEYYMLKQTKELDSIAQLSHKLREERVFEMEFEHINGEDLLQQQFTSMEYDKTLMYISLEIKDDFKAITSRKDTIACVGVHFERHFKVSPFSRVLLYFSGIPEGETIQLIYQDQLFDNGTFKFKFNEIPFKT